MSQNATKTTRRLHSLRHQLGDNCWWCGLVMRFDGPGKTPGRVDATIEHLVPKVDGGTGARDNLALAHSWCNSARHQRDADALRKKMVMLVSAWLRNGSNLRQGDAYVIALDKVAA